MLEIRTVW